jgi:hypothetical protein
VLARFGAAARGRGVDVGAKFLYILVSNIRK